MNSDDVKIRGYGRDTEDSNGTVQKFVVFYENRGRIKGYGLRKLPDILSNICDETTLEDLLSEQAEKRPAVDNGHRVATS